MILPQFIIFLGNTNIRQTEKIPRIIGINKSFWQKFSFTKNQ